MILGKRRWAMRVLDAGGLSVVQPDGDAILRILLHQAKSPSNPGKGDKGAVVTGAITMVSDFAALPDLVELGLTHAQAAEALSKLGVGVDAVLDQHLARAGA
ncbi:hypothetical protein [Brevundimonas sp.]|uniref:hypothetical protein n=1 Tax=Brevundimonas sp. TaxID=1871086 RepID=UPI0035B07FB0